MINNFLFGDNYPIYNIEESENKLVLYLKSNVHAMLST